MTKLTAVNRLLDSIKESPVNTLSAPLSEEAASAQNVIDEVSEQVQRQGWTFNTDYNVTIQRDVDGLIDLGPTVLKVEFPRSNRLTLRGTRVYDIVTASYTLVDDITFPMIIRNLPWDEIPSVAQGYIVYQAMRIFQDRTLGTKDGERPITRQESDALADLKRDHSSQRRPNMLTSPQISEVAFRNGYEARDYYRGW